MKRFAVLILAGALSLGLIGPAAAGVTGGETGPTTTVKVVQDTQIHETTTVHRVVKGMAAHQLAPNFLDNDWDEGSLAGLSRAEQDYLRTVSGLGHGVWYYIDLNSKTVQTRAFRDLSSETVGPTEREVITVRTDNGYETVYKDTTHIYRNNVTYQVVADVYDYSPLVLDLNGDGRIDVARNEWMPHAPRFYKENARFFDMTGDGTVDFTEWMSTGASDGILVRPDGSDVVSALQLFGTAGGYTDGFEKLSIVCDADGNGWIEGAELEGLYVWVDANSDGRMDRSELRLLSEYGIQKLSTKHSRYVGSYVTTDGTTRTMWDWWPAVQETRKFRAR